MLKDSEPDLKLLGLSVWVDGRQFPGKSDYYDGNWLNVRARMEAPGAAVKCAGSILMASDFQRFRDELGAMDSQLAGEATLSSYEPNLKLTLTIDARGHMQGEVEITPDHMSQFHRFSIDLDQSYLSDLIASCDAILARYPAVGVD